MISKVKDMDSVKALFEGWEETIIWSCLQGIMGDVYVDDNEASFHNKALRHNETKQHLEKPQSAMAVLGDFCFFAGKANADLVKYKPYKPPRFDTGLMDTSQCFDAGSMRSDAESTHSEAAAGHSDMIIMVPQNRQWAELIEDIYQNAARKTERYAIKKEAHVFDRAYLKQIVENINKGSHHSEALYHNETVYHNNTSHHRADYVLRKIDESLYQRCKEQSWSRDLVSQFMSYDMYSRYGLGFVILKDNEIVSGASSYSAYRQGIEIEIDTREDYRRRGLAYVCGARLILECLDRGLYPSWDAQNKASVALAEKLGYHYSHAYSAYEITG